MLLHFISQAVQSTSRVDYAIIPLALAAIPSVASAVNKWLTGNKQNKMANEITATNSRPEYKIPKGIKDNAALAAYLAANGKLPGTGTFENRIASGQSRTVGGAIDSQRDPSSIAAILAASEKNYNDSMADIATKGAMYKDQAINRSMNAQGVLAGYEDKAWDWNSKQKYLSAMAAASALKNAAGQNKGNAFNDVANVGTTLLANSNLFGGTPATPTERTAAPAGLPTPPVTQVDGVTPDQQLLLPSGVPYQTWNKAPGAQPNRYDSGDPASNPFMDLIKMYGGKIH